MAAASGRDAPGRTSARGSGQLGGIRKSRRGSGRPKKRPLRRCERNPLQGRRVKLGELEFHIVSAGHVLLDGGAMFGVIPRPLWEKKMQPDARNRVTLSMNCLLIHAGGKRILVETGAGDKMSAKVREIYGLDGPFLDDGLRKYGLRPEDIDIVLNTHLHFDHCGGNTRVEKDKVVPAFPNARYMVHRGEYEHAMNPNERDRASYFPDNYAPLEAAGNFALLDEDGEI